MFCCRFFLPLFSSSSSSLHFLFVAVVFYTTLWSLSMLILNFFLFIFLFLFYSCFGSSADTHRERERAREKGMSDKVGFSLLDFMLSLSFWLSYSFAVCSDWVFFASFVLFDFVLSLFHCASDIEIQRVWFWDIFSLSLKRWSTKWNAQTQMSTFRFYAAFDPVRCVFLLSIVNDTATEVHGTERKLQNELFEVSFAKSFTALCQKDLNKLQKESNFRWKSLFGPTCKKWRNSGHEMYFFSTSSSSIKNTVLALCKRWLCA